MISIVIPTYRESESIETALRRAAAALRKTGEPFELIIVDDASDDGTADRAESLAGEIPVRVIRRVGERGLATAVLKGWAMARGDILGVMDGDLQHPPEVLADLAAAIRREDADLANASRYCAGGGSEHWPWYRRIVSAGATHLATSVLPLLLEKITDPMSGMFLVRTRALEGVELSPIGYKILLEVAGKGKIKKIVEVPYQFAERERGGSKLGMRQQMEYIFHLARLARSTGQLYAWMKYALVGLTGGAVNVGAIYAMAKGFSWPVPLAVAVAIEVSLLWNFAGNEATTFRGPRARGALRRLARYETVCSLGAILNLILTLLLFRAGLPLWGAAIAGIALDGIFNLGGNVPAIWRVWEVSDPSS